MIMLIFKRLYTFIYLSNTLLMLSEAEQPIITNLISTSTYIDIS